MRFQTDRRYSRADVIEHVGSDPSVRGGKWFTGIVEHDGEFFIFANIGITGRTGHNYLNRWEGEFLRWYHKRGSDIGWSTVKDLLRSDATIHLFSRSADRDPFEYHGYAIPVNVLEESSPVEILLAVTEEPPQREVFGSAELKVVNPHVEGLARRIQTTIYERDPTARQECIDYYGARCTICDLSFEDRYGPMGAGYIHVHHLVPISGWGEEYEVDPVGDLRPVCPNCHAMVHQRNPPYSVEYVEAALKAPRRPDV